MMKSFQDKINVNNIPLKSYSMTVPETKSLDIPNNGNTDSNESSLSLKTNTVKSKSKNGSLKSNSRNSVSDSK